ncbi:D-xylose transporter XylE (plasmid) [Fulvitalea axinellae]|uniref:D-xylose transporter XylE n=2 Tax=Fulvitalea axinellae TaxID=1182444 RepID=A0AAU9CK48_9BACT|nr:D-xylose transporter XylE [Fulvitalea axinellae]
MTDNKLETPVMEPKATGAGMGYIYLLTAVAALGGLLFGYDTAVISGAIGPLRTYFGLDSMEMGWAASSALVGCMIGASIAGFASGRLGRKKSLLLAAVLFVASAIGSAIAMDFSEFIVYRIIGGVGVGIASMVSPMYIAEMAPAEMRGKLVSCNQLAIVIGMLVVYFVNYYISLQGDEDWLLNSGWRWMFGSEIIPAGLFFALLFFVPESPRWLAKEGREKEALSVLGKVSVNLDPSKALDEIRTSLAETTSNLEGMNWRNSKVVFLVFVGVMLSVFQQITGINVFMYYAPEIFKNLGSESDTAMLQTVMVGAVNLVFTVVAIFTVDKFGRKPLMLLGTAGMGICIVTIGTAAYFQNTDTWLLPFVLGYIACFAVSMGPVVWVLLSEIFPNKIRSGALSVAVAAQWISNYLVSQTFPLMMENDYLQAEFHGGFPFWVYGSMCVVAIAFIWKFVPETKGKSLEEMQKIWDL